MKNPKTVILFIYNSYKDPIVQGSVLRYIHRYKKILKGKARFILITYEQGNYAMSEEERVQALASMKQDDIQWLPIRYHSGGVFILFKKLFDLLQGLAYVSFYKWKSGASLIYTVGTTSGSFGYLLSKVLRIDLLVHTYEPHSEFMADFGIWSKRSLNYKLLNKFEKIIGRKANYIMTGTDAMRERLKAWNSKARVFKVPSCVDLDKFQFNEQKRQEIRENLKLNGKHVLLFMGKFGGIYYEQEAFQCFKAYIEQEDENFYPHILVLSLNDKDWIRAMMNKHGIKPGYFTLDYVSFDQVQDYISASDIGFCGIPSLPSQKFRSPIKNGEYLACGIPYIVPKGISEDDLIARQKGVGVVLDDLSQEELELKMKQVKALLLKGDRELRERCRKVAIEYRGIQQTDAYYQEVFNG
jgi:hypothetical protein